VQVFNNIHLLTFLNYYRFSVSLPFSKPSAFPVFSALALPYTFPHIPVVFRLLYALDNFDEACPFSH
jgi:hypothetical protein